MDSYEEIGKISTQEAKESVDRQFPGGATLYAVLDYAVCFGVYRNKQFLMGIGEEKAEKALEWEYVRELRIFDEDKELLLISDADGWSGRIRNDQADAEQEYSLTEWQKLWGKAAENSQQGIPGWTLLVSGRGTGIQIPQLLQAEEAALCVRRYMRIPDVKNNEELVFQKDIRIVEICPWKGEGGDDESVKKISE